VAARRNGDGIIGTQIRSGNGNPINAPNQSAINLPTIYFATNRADVPSSSKALLQQEAALMKTIACWKGDSGQRIHDSAGIELPI